MNLKCVTKKKSEWGSHRTSNKAAKQTLFGTFSNTWENLSWSSCILYAGPHPLPYTVKLIKHVLHANITNRNEMTKPEPWFNSNLDSLGDLWSQSIMNPETLSALEIVEGAEIRVEQFQTRSVWDISDVLGLQMCKSHSTCIAINYVIGKLPFFCSFWWYLREILL